MSFETRTVLTYDRYLYNPYLLKSVALSVEQQRKEYARLRSIANKRLKSFEKNQKFTGSQVFISNIGQYDKPASALTEQELSYKLSQVANFIMSAGGSVSGQKAIRDKVIEKLEKHGVKSVTRKNYDTFVKYMEHYRANKLTQVYDSDEVVAMFEKDVNAGEDEVQNTLKNFESEFLNFVNTESRGVES